MNKKILIAGLLVSVMLLVPINSAYSNNCLFVKNNEENIHNDNLLDDTWIKIIDYTTYDTGNSVIQDTDGNYIFVVTGEPWSGWTGAIIYKINSNGDTIWIKEFGDLDDDRKVSSIIEINNCNYVATGLRDWKVWLVKLSKNGDKIWDKGFYIPRFAEGNEVIQTFDGGFAIAGYALNYSGDLDCSNIFLLKTDNNGNETWIKTFDNKLYNYGFSLKQTPDGGYIIVGYTSPSDYGKDKMYLLKTDENGTLLWEKTYGGSGYSAGLSLLITDDGEYIITGCTRTNLVDDYDIWLLKTDENGTLLWEKTYGGKYDDIGYSVKTTDGGGYILTGSSYISLFNCDVILIKTDNLGNKEWSKTTGSSYVDYAKSIQKTTDGGFILTGTCADNESDFPFGGKDAFLMKTDSNGNAPPLSKTKDIGIRNRVFDSSFLRLLFERLFGIWRFILV